MPFLSQFLYVQRQPLSDFFCLISVLPVLKFHINRISVYTSSVWRFNFFFKDIITFLDAYIAPVNLSPAYLSPVDIWGIYNLGLIYI